MILNHSNHVKAVFLSSITLKKHFSVFIKKLKINCYLKNNSINKKTPKIFNLKMKTIENRLKPVS